MDIILQGIPRTICYIDDILITGVNDQEHLANLEEVLRQLQYHGITLKKTNVSLCVIVLNTLVILLIVKDCTLPQIQLRQL